MKKYLWIALGLVASLLCALGVGARLPSGQAGSRGVYIQFDNIFDNLDPAHGYPVSGGHERWEWEALEPNYDGDYRFTNLVRPFVTNQATRNKKVGLGIETAIKRGTATSAPDGTLAVPPWLYQTYSNVVYLNPRGGGAAYYALHFLNPNYQAKYAELINDFADWLAANPDVASNVAWIEIGVGADSETQPADWYSTTASRWDYLFYYDSPPINLGYTAAQWEAYIKWCIDTYYNAFRVNHPSLSNITLYLNCAPNYPSHDGYTGPSTRTAVTDYAAQKSIPVGLKNNGLQMDREGAGLYAPLEKWGVPWQLGKNVPIAWETYEQWLWDETHLYWGLLAGLDKYPDMIEPDRYLMQNGNYLDEWNWAEPYLATTSNTTPGMWCALRDTLASGGEPGNYEFYMFQRDDYAPGGVTVFEHDVGTGKEGRYTRRTDQPTNPYMFFKIYNSCVNGNSNHDPFTVNVTYLDSGTDTWRLYYDSFSGAAYREVVKTNTNTWKKVSWTLTDARFGDGLDGGTDLKIDCRNDGNEWIHMVEVRRAGGTTPTPPTPTPSPTPTTLPCTIQGSVTLQYRPSPPDPRWVVPLTVVVGGASYNTTTDNTGDFTLAGLTPGTYDISVKNSHTLRNLKSGVTLANGLNVLDFGTLLEGDASNDNCVNITDFSVLRLGFNPAYDARADFNQDGAVNITDFSILKANFGVCGDILAPHPPQGSARVSAAATGTVHLSIEPPSSSVMKDQVFSVQIQVAAGGQPVDGAEVHLNFDPLYLQAVDSGGNPVSAIESSNALNVPIQNIVSNEQGHIDFAAGTFDSPPSGTFALATIRFKALQGTHGGSTSLLFVDRQGSPTNVTYAGNSVLEGTDNGVIVVTSPYYLYLPKISH